MALRPHEVARSRFELRVPAGCFRAMDELRKSYLRPMLATAAKVATMLGSNDETE